MKAEIAVVTGASRGIGRAAALAFARRGLDVALLGRHHDDLEAVAAEATSEHRVRALAIPCDVSVSSDVARAAERTLAELGTPLVVVNNAGIVERSLVEDTTDESWDRVIGVNLRGPFVVSRAFLPAMKARNAGRIVHVSSISGTLGTPRSASYNASKWALIGFMKSLAEELRGSNLQTVAILPGSVDTDMLVGSEFPAQMSADDVARTILWAALDAPNAIQGTALPLFG